MATDDEVIGNAAAAAYVGVGTSTWSGYVTRLRAPAPIRREVVRGYAQPVWRTTDLDAWMAERPGQGARTDRNGVSRSADSDQGPKVRRSRA